MVRDFVSTAFAMGFDTLKGKFNHCWQRECGGGGIILALLSEGRGRIKILSKVKSRRMVRGVAFEILEAPQNVGAVVAHSV